MLRDRLFPFYTKATCVVLNSAAQPDAQINACMQTALLTSFSSMTFYLSTSKYMKDTHMMPQAVRQLSRVDLYQPCCKGTAPKASLTIQANGPRNTVTLRMFCIKLFSVMRRAHKLAFNSKTLWRLGKFVSSWLAFRAQLGALMLR